MTSSCTASDTTTPPLLSSSRCPGRFTPLALFAMRCAADCASDFRVELLGAPCSGARRELLRLPAEAGFAGGRAATGLEPATRAVTRASRAVAGFGTCIWPLEQLLPLLARADRRCLAGMIIAPATAPGDECHLQQLKSCTSATPRNAGLELSGSRCGRSVRERCYNALTCAVSTFCPALLRTTFRVSHTRLAHAAAGTAGPISNAARLVGRKCPTEQLERKWKSRS